MCALLITAQGQYTVVANAYTADGRPITCLTATVKFYTAMEYGL
jgi:hypothetical protein